MLYRYGYSLGCTDDEHTVSGTINNGGEQTTDAVTDVYCTPQAPLRRQRSD
jgi:hypothetical protein